MLFNKYIVEENVLVFFAQSMSSCPYGSRYLPKGVPFFILQQYYLIMLIENLVQTIHAC